jgi:hypothetical protein
MSLKTLAFLIASDWSSGGGFVLKDAHNPWFVQNTKTVDYCIQRDAEHFSVDEDKLAVIIDKAIAYWKNEFARSSMDRVVGGYRVLVATQEFRRVDCSSGVPLVFQFGVLSAAQQAQLGGHPGDVVGVAQRTAYDVPTLTGKGFVYLAADSGPLKPAVTMPGTTLPDGFWSLYDGTRLYRVLAHEMAHVFGIPHRGTEHDLMGEGYPEFLLSMDPWHDDGHEHLGGYQLPAFFNYDYKMNYVSCSAHNVERYGLPTGKQCIHLRGTLKDGWHWTVSDGPTTAEQDFALIHFYMYFGGGEDLVRLYVPQGHPLFGSYSGYLRAVEYDPLRNVTAQIEYAGGAHPTDSVMIFLYPGDFEILAQRYGVLTDFIDGKYDEQRISK